MPVVRTSGKAMGEGNRPDWCQVTGAGVFVLPDDGTRFDCHYHDCHEYWLILDGKAKVMSEGKEFYIGGGDILCTRAGDEHDILEIYEPLSGFWFEDATPQGGRTGHLHRTPEKAAGHPVPCKPIPEDFPA